MIILWFWTVFNSEFCPLPDIAVLYMYIPNVFVPMQDLIAIYNHLFCYADSPGGQQCNLRNLLHYVHTTKWYRLGLELMGDEAVTQLDVIDYDHKGDKETALRKTLSLCLRADPDLSWQKVVKALRKIGETRNAKDIEDKFC